MIASPVSVVQRAARDSLIKKALSEIYLPKSLGGILTLIYRAALNRAGVFSVGALTHLSMAIVIS